MKSNGSHLGSDHYKYQVLAHFNFIKCEPQDQTDQDLHFMPAHIIAKKDISLNWQKIKSWDKHFNIVCVEFELFKHRCLVHTMQS